MDHHQIKQTLWASSQRPKAPILGVRTWGVSSIFAAAGLLVVTASTLADQQLHSRRTNYPAMKAPRRLRPLNLKRTSSTHRKRGLCYLIAFASSAHHYCTHCTEITIQSTSTPLPPNRNCLKCLGLSPIIVTRQQPPQRTG